VYNYYVYELCSSENPFLPFYVGKGKGNRMYTHERGIIWKCHRNTYLKRKILKIKRNGYQVVYRKIGENLSEQDAFTIEKDMIAFNRSLGFKLCNHTNGGEGVSGIYKPMLEKTKQKISISNTGKIRTEEMRKRYSIAKSGIPKSEIHKKNLSKANKGKICKPHSYETKLKISKANKGKTRTLEQCNNMSIAHIGQIPWNKGKFGYKRKVTKIYASAEIVKNFIVKNKLSQDEYYKLFHAKKLPQGFPCVVKIIYNKPYSWFSGRIANQNKPHINKKIKR
jgi:hypothetical protein